MRPLELELTSFRSYASARVDLRPHELVVIAGDTGAGKSSLLDAISLALYGRTPELASGTSELVTLGEDAGEVRLTFLMDGAVWRVTRRIGPRAIAPRHLLERLADDGGAVVEAVEGEREVGARIGRIVGLSYEAFTSTVLLAQGQFARFFQARPGERDEILRDLFGIPSLEPARAAAHAAEAAARATADALATEAARLPDAGSAEAFAVARAARSAAADAAAATRLRPALVALRAAEDARRATNDAAARVTRTITALPADGVVADLARERAALAVTLEEARALRESAARSAREATADRSATEGRHGGDHALLARRREEARRLAEIERELPRREREHARRAEALAGRRADLERATAEVAALVSREADLRRRAEAILAHAEVGDRRRAAEAEVARATDRLETLRAEREAAERAVETARETIRAASLAEHAAHLWADLHPGDDCPVCGQPIGFLPGPQAAPPHPGREALAAAEAAAAAARSAERAAATEGARALATLEAVGQLTIVPLAPEDAAAGPTQAEALLAEADTLLAALREPAEAADAEAARIAVETGRVEATGAALAADRETAAVLERTLGGPGADALRSVDAAWAELAEMVRAEEAAREVERSAEGAFREAAARLAEIEQARVAPVRMALARAAAETDVPAAAADADLIAEAQRLSDALRARLDDLTAEADRAQVDADRAGGVLAAAGVPDVEQAERRIDAAREARARARAELTAIWRGAWERRRLLAAAEDARREAALHGQVAADLRADRFPRFLLQAQRERLADAAAVRLQDFTRGAYRFLGREAGDGEDPLSVVDTARAGSRRHATLSGGERFLASLALALALGDMAAGAGGRLDCLFLDEGFSALDADSLELAIAALERLAGGGRLVAVITHLPGVAERLGAAIRVAKDASGVSRIVEEGTPPAAGHGLRTRSDDP